MEACYSPVLHIQVLQQRARAAGGQWCAAARNGPMSLRRCNNLQVNNQHCKLARGSAHPFRLAVVARGGPAMEDSQAEAMAAGKVAHHSLRSLQTLQRSGVDSSTGSRHTIGENEQEEEEAPVVVMFDGSGFEDEDFNWPAAKALASDENALAKDMGWSSGAHSRGDDDLDFLDDDENEVCRDNGSWYSPKQLKMGWRSVKSLQRSGQEILQRELGPGTKLTKVNLQLVLDRHGLSYPKDACKAELLELLVIDALESGVGVPL